MFEARTIPPESLATERLLLRKPRAQDAAPIFITYAQDPEVVRYLTFLPRRDLNDTVEVVERFLESWRAGKSYCWLIFRRDDEQLIGAISAREDQGINLGYLLARPFWGQGFMSEALGAIVEWFERRIDDGPIEIAISIFVPYSAYLAGELIHASGVLSVFAAGLYLGRKSARFYSPGVRLQANADVLRELIDRRVR